MIVSRKRKTNKAHKTWHKMVPFLVIASPHWILFLHFSGASPPVWTSRNCLRPLLGQKTDNRLQADTASPNCQYGLLPRTWKNNKIKQDKRRRWHEVPWETRTRVGNRRFDAKQARWIYAIPPSQLKCDWWMMAERNKKQPPQNDIHVFLDKQKRFFGTEPWESVSTSHRSCHAE